jgi:adenine C2-methylase RlmN of 23S rRNA A2503 and tRNA A37
MEKVDIKNFCLESLEGFLQGLGKEKYRAKQIFKWLYQRGATTFDDMTNLSKDYRRELSVRKSTCLFWKTVQASNPFSSPRKIGPLFVFPPRWGVPWAAVSV